MLVCLPCFEYWVFGCLVSCCGLAPFWIVYGWWVGRESVVVGVMSFTVQVQDLNVGKNCKVLLGFLELNSLVSFKKVGQLWLQLAWSLVLHDAHFLTVLGQVLVLWCSVQLLQVSFSSVQSLAR